jgi:hypothetical protein
MALYKSSQVMEVEDDINNLGNEDEVILYEEKPSAEDVIELHKPDDSLEITFKLPALPGSDVEPLEVSSDDDVEVAEKEDKNDLQKDNIEVVDPWDWQAKSKGPAGVLEWVKERFNNIPRHSGRETAGIERAIAYLKRINSEMSKAASNDYDGKIDISKFEEARREIYSAIERLEDAKDKLEQTHYKRKKGETEASMVKEGQKATRVGGIIVTVPLLISRVARVCINGTVSAGHDIEDLFSKQVKKYNLSDREQAEAMQLLFDMGYPLRQDRGYLSDEKVDTTSSNNFDWAANYSA